MPHILKPVLVRELVFFLAVVKTDIMVLLIVCTMPKVKISSTRIRPIGTEFPHITTDGKANFLQYCNLIRRYILAI